MRILRKLGIYDLDELDDTITVPLINDDTGSWSQVELASKGIWAGLEIMFNTLKNDSMFEDIAVQISNCSVENLSRSNLVADLGLPN